MLLAYCKQALAVVQVFLLPALIQAQPVRSHKYIFENKDGKGYDLSVRDSVIIYYELPELDIYNIINETGTFFRISVPGHSPTVETGKPELPVLSKLIRIPDHSHTRIKISDVKSLSINPAAQGFRGLLYPSQEGESKSQEIKQRFLLDKKAYSSGSLIASDTVRIEKLGSVRGKKLASLMISPVQYDPLKNTLEVITSMKIAVIFDANAPDQGPIHSESRLFNESLAKGVVNYYPEDLITGYSDKPVEMIILTDTTFRKSLEPLYRWKTQKGYRLHILYTGKKYAGETFQEIKSSINKVYESSLANNGHAPEYLLIMGDVSKVPYYGTGYLSDMYYGEFDGSGDFIPDMFIGRIPVSDTLSAKAAVNKILQYEKFNFADTNTFYNRALITTGKDPTYSSYMNGQVKYAITNYLKPEYGINNYHFYYPEGFTKKDSILKLISSGLSFVNYTGHGNSSGWLHVEIKSPDIDGFSNRNMYPFVISNACRTAQFNDTASFGNKMVTAINKGAIGFIGCTNDSYWDEDFYWSVGAGTPNSDPQYSETQLGAYDRLFHRKGEHPSEWYTTMGQVNYGGNLSVSASTSSRKKYYWETYALLGDPSITPIIGKQDPFAINLPDTLPNGIRSLALTIDPFAYAAISHSDTLWDASFASPSGSVVLELPGLSDDSCLVVITGQNKKPFIKTIYISEIQDEYINLSGTGINDINGNNNGKADFGENLYLKLKLSNLGMTDADNLSITAASTSPWVTINNGAALVALLPKMSEISLNEEIEFTVDKDVPDQGIITFDLTIRDSKTEKRYKADVLVHAPRLEIINCIIDDSAVGNNNFIADPGETFNIILQVRNSGSSNTSGQLLIQSAEPILTILNPDVKSGILQYGEVTEIPVAVSLSGSASFGDYINLSALIDCDPFTAQRNFSFRVGRIRESFESSSFKIFPWVNLSPVPWIITASNAIDGNLSAQSGRITHNGTSSLMLRAVFAEDDSLTFFTKISSEPNYDYLEFRLNNNEIFQISGETSWERHSVEVPAGENRLEWIYKKDNSVSQGSDCAWLDLIDFSKSTPIKYIHKDLEVARIVTPVQKEVYGHDEPVEVRLLNLGSDTVYSYYLGYTINKKEPVFQKFDTPLAPYSDSVTVTFNRRADMDLSGDYEITVFGHDNNDDFLMNDTASVKVENLIMEETIVIYPNPFSSHLNVVINSRSMLDIRISLTDAAGKRVIDLKQALHEGENKISLNTQHLSPSFYILSISGGKFTRAVPVIRLRE
ncbi:MAG: C25 family cysteine peptidase [Bacteroidales bacterium]|jgi:hypothetical protein|nr:C25 family cysteine peptidase [Bacteroidales bacterium]